MSNPAEKKDFRAYLDPRTLAKVESLELRARLVVEGLMTGQHRSPYKGFSIEFAQHRPYVQGDDLRYIDWKVFGRSDRHYIKQFEAETNLQLMLVVDASESMAFGGTTIGEHGRKRDIKWSKFDHATAIAASLGYMASGQRDSVGLALFDDKLRRFMKPSNSPRQWRLITNELTTTPQNQKTNMESILNDVAEQLHGRSVIVILSDLFGDAESAIRGIRQLRHRRHDVIVLQTIDHDELTFPFEQTTMFKGMEQMGDLVVEPRGLKEAYLEELRNHTAKLEKACHGMRVDYVQIDTSLPLDVTLPGFLAARMGRMK